MTSGITGRPLVVVFEDHPLVSRAIRRFLEAAGIEVLEAESARQVRIALIELPVEMLIAAVGPPRGSAAWLREALDERPDVKVIYTSTTSRDELAGELLPDAPFLEKPFDLDELLTLIGRAKSDVSRLS